MSTIRPHMAPICFASCPSADLRAHLLHEWEKGFGFGISIASVEAWYSGSSKSASRRFAARLEQDGDFAQCLMQTRELVKAMVDGFSPKQLIDQGVLASLPSEIRDKLKTAVHERYLAETTITDLKHSLSEAIRDLETAILKFAAAWKAEPPHNAEEVKRGYTTVQDAARHVRDVLDQLPKGILLP